MKFNHLLIFIVVSTSITVSCSMDNSNKKPAQGELATEFQPVTSVESSVEAYEPMPTKSKEDILKEEGWENQNFSNGVMPDCYNYIPSYGSLENELEVTVGGGTDVVIKVMSTSTDRCVRYVYINSGNVYTLKNIPEGTFYLKIAYGKNWISKTMNGQCLGKFTSGALYEKGEDILDFNKQYTADGYNIPSFSLKLDVISGAVDNTFNSNGISEDDFNN